MTRGRRPAAGERLAERGPEAPRPVQEPASPANHPMSGPTYSDRDRDGSFGAEAIPLRPAAERSAAREREERLRLVTGGRRRLPLPRPRRAAGLALLVVALVASGLVILGRDGGATSPQGAAPALPRPEHGSRAALPRHPRAAAVARPAPKPRRLVVRGTRPRHHPGPAHRRRVRHRREPAPARSTPAAAAASVPEAPAAPPSPPPEATPPSEPAPEAAPTPEQAAAAPAPKPTSTPQDPPPESSQVEQQFGFER